MSGTGHSAPRLLARLFRRLLTGPIGDEACDDMEREYLNRRQTHGNGRAFVWYAGHLFVPGTWILAGKLRRRGGRARPAVPFSALDFKLGLRMLVRYPGLTIVGVLAMAFAIMAGAATFEFINQMVRPTLPLHEGHRIVAIQIRDLSTNRIERRVMHDFVTWRDETEALQDLGAFRWGERTLVTGSGRGEPVRMAEISASAFRVARVAPLMGRTLTDADGQFGAPPVAVIGYRLWQTRFAGDPDVLERTVRLSGVATTVVGVMPEGFSFPVAEHLWVPLRMNYLDYGRREGPGITMFARLAPGVSLVQAQTALTMLGLRAASAYPATHEHLRPEVKPYAESLFPLPAIASLGLRSINLFLITFVVLVCGNVALLMFARAATRENEMAVRAALGASRTRIITQLFAEALVLGGFAAAIGLAFAGLGLRWVLSIFGTVFFGARGLPFWFSDSLAPSTALYAAGLTVLGAVIAGVVPAIKVTGYRLEPHLRRATAGSAVAQLGGIWTAVIITQVALTVVFPLAGLLVYKDLDDIRSLDVGFPEREYLSVQIEMDQEDGLAGSHPMPRAEYLARFTETFQELERRLDREPTVLGTTFGDRLPRMYHPHRLIEVDGNGPSAPDSGRGHRVTSVQADVDYFDVLHIPILAGRGFHSGDLGADPGVVIVNQSFVNRVLAGSNPIGRRVRYTFFEELRGVFVRDEENDPWYEIVGVVRDLATAQSNSAKAAAFYHPVAPDYTFPVQMTMAVHVRGDPEALTPQLQTIAATIDPSLRLSEIMPLDQVHFEELRFYNFWLTVAAIVIAVTLTLALAGIYSVMSFTVSRRTREIGIRVALGSDHRRVVTTILSRPLSHVVIGVFAGSCIIGAIVFKGFGYLSLLHIGLLGVYTAFMMGVCMLACIVPTRRALNVEPTQALRADG